VWEDATFWDPSWTGHAGGLGSNQDDIHRFIEALGTGELVSKASHEAQLAPTTVGVGPNTATKYFGIGVGVVNGWVYTNPGLQGLHGAIGTLPGKKLSMVIYNTTTPETNVEKQATATTLFESVSALLAPDQPMKLNQA
jgi:D-alanyl-D-alanine carboxypeptidase